MNFLDIQDTSQKAPVNIETCYESGSIVEERAFLHRNGGYYVGDDFDFIRVAP